MQKSRSVLIVVALAVTTLSIAAVADAATAKKSGKTTKGRSAGGPLAEVADVPGLPRVLLIGDSISLGYTIPVRHLLEGKANVHRPPANCGPSERGVQNLEKWLGTNHWDVIHFNFGLHDLKWIDGKGEKVPPGTGRQMVPLPDYEKNLRTIVARLKRTGARLIWCSTTPVPADSPGRVKNAELDYNRIAARVMAENGVPTDDLHAFVVPRQSEIQLPKNVHFTKEGYQALARQVAKAIEAQLK